ncbi:MAG: hypothetical protein QXD60_01175 [Nanopusillaceae archaeon]
MRTTIGTGYQSASWSCPYTSLSPDWAIVVEITITRGTRTNTYQSITLVLNAGALLSSSWNINRYTMLDSTGAYFRAGSSYTNNYIQNFNWLQAPRTWVNIDGTWRRVAEVWVNINGNWRQVQGIWVNINGTWRAVM